ncbi:MAG: diguanylate cyclase [Pseudomonadota bacterium]
MQESTATTAVADAEHWKTQYRELVAEQDEMLRDMDRTRRLIGELLGLLSASIDSDPELAAEAGTLRTSWTQVASPLTAAMFEQTRALAPKVLARVDVDGVEADLSTLESRLREVVAGTPEIETKSSGRPVLSEHIESLFRSVLEHYQAQQQRLSETERFLAEVSGALAGLEQYVASAREDTAAGRAATEVLQSDVAETVGSIEQRVADTNDLDELRSSVRDGISALSDRMRTFTQTEHERYAAAERRSAELESEIASLRAHTRSLEQTLEAQAGKLLRDQLTGVHSRRALDARIEEGVARHQRQSQSLAYTIWDIDHFKRINDSYGHPAGDHILRSVAQTLERYTRASDFVARLGGEEFVILLPDTTEQNAMIIADKLREVIAASQYEFDGHNIAVTISCGVATLGEGASAQQLYEHADRALYRAKQSGRNRCEAARD